MNIWLQKSALMEPRTGLPNFDDFAGKSVKFSISARCAFLCTTRNWFFFPKDSYLGALRLFLWVQAAVSGSGCRCRSTVFRRLGYVGALRIGGDPHGAQDSARVVFPGTHYTHTRGGQIYNPHAARRWDFTYTKNSARPGSDFTYTKNSARPRLDLSYTKNSARLRSDFTYTKNLGRTIVDCLFLASEKSWKIKDIVKIFPRCAR